MLTKKYPSTTRIVGIVLRSYIPNSGDITEGGRDYEVTVNFDKVGVKKMFASFAKLKKV